MEQDYYHILGVSATADLDNIKRAFRRKVMEVHPDRGGSHAAMVLVNEAWEVLSNPELRARYDEARTHASDRGAQEAAAADAQQARQRAEKYPRGWEDVEAWLNRLSVDFTEAKYAGISDDFCPIIENSISGVRFISAGATLGAILSFFVSMHLGKMRGLRVPFYVMWLLGATGGAWFGAGVHRLIASLISKTRNQASLRAQQQERRGAGREQTPPPGPSGATRVISCGRCGQRLRVPAVQTELRVTCRSCGHKFTYAPE